MATKQAIILFRVKLVWLDFTSMVAAAMAINAVRMSVGDKVASVIDPPWSSSKRPSGTDICILPCPKGVACT